MQPKSIRESGSRQPPWIMRHFFDPLTVLLVDKLGLDDHNGTRILEVKGRKSGVRRLTPVRVLELEGQRHIVAMYGESNWARNLRADGRGTLRLGRNLMDFQAVELTGGDKLPVFRAYLRRWWSLVGPLTGLASPDVPDEELQKVAASHPVFRLG
ncbi:MAG TPA: nitroreductase/quinone reductase family protein [Anaerolineales bacterium]